MKITKDWLEKQDACTEGKEWFISEGIEDPIAGIKNLVEKDHWEWANWLIVRVMTRKQYLAYAIFSAEQVIDIYEKKYPKEKAPRLAIEAAKAVLENDTPAARDAARAAAWAAGAARAAARAAAWAAGAARAAAWAAGDAALKEMRRRIINYGIGLLENKSHS